MKESTDRLIQRVAILAMLVIVAFTAYRVLSARANASAPTYKVGETLPLQAPGARTTVVMFARSTCSACQRSKPIFKEIHDAVTARMDARMILQDVVGIGEPELAFAAEFGLTKADVVKWDASRDPKLHAVPTFVVLDGKGEILLVSQGVTDETVTTIKLLLARP